MSPGFGTELKVIFITVIYSVLTTCNTILPVTDSYIDDFLSKIGVLVSPTLGSDSSQIIIFPSPSFEIE